MVKVYDFESISEHNRVMGMERVPDWPTFLGTVVSLFGGGYLASKGYERLFEKDPEGFFAIPDTAGEVISFIVGGLVVGGIVWAILNGRARNARSRPWERE